MEAQQVLLYLFPILVIGAWWFSQRRLDNKVLCTFRRANLTKIEKLIPIDSQKVKFDGGEYNVNPKRITWIKYSKGLNAFFPTRVPSLDYSWHSQNPHDPRTFKTSWDTPEVREATRQEESLKAFAKGISTQVGGQSKFPEWLFPMITIGFVVLIGYWVYQMSQQLAVIEQLVKLR